MHVKDATPEHRIATKVRIDVPEISFKTGKRVMVKRYYELPLLLPGKLNDLADILRRNAGAISKLLPKTAIRPAKGTIGGIPMRVKSVVWPDHSPSTGEIGCSVRHMYWRCEKRDGKRVIITSCFYKGDAAVDDDQKALLDHPFFVAEEVHPVPANWVVKDGAVGGINSEVVTKSERYALFKSAVEGGSMWTPAMAAFGVEASNVFEETFPKFKGKAGKGYVIETRRIKDSAKVLYRLLSWMREITVKNGDFYKGPLMDIRLGDTGAIASFYFYKCELACQLWCPAEKATLPPPRRMPAMIVICGVPGSKAPRGSVKAADDVMEKWDFLLKLLQTKTSVYSGNDFVV